jgi:hypothetical protein
VTCASRRTRRGANCVHRMAGICPGDVQTGTEIFRHEGKRCCAGTPSGSQASRSLRCSRSRWQGPKNSSLCRIRVRGQSSRAAIFNLAPISSKPCEEKMSRPKNRVRSIVCIKAARGEQPGDARTFSRIPIEPSRVFAATVCGLLATWLQAVTVFMNRRSPLRTRPCTNRGQSAIDTHEHRSRTCATTPKNMPVHLGLH